MPGSDGLYHHGSHRQLLWHAVSRSPAELRLDAIIIPTRRALAKAHLAEAAALARDQGRCTLVTLHSGTCTTAAQAVVQIPAGVDLIALDVPARTRLRQPRWAASRLLDQFGFAHQADLSVKRNLGLMLSHMLGWSRILFLDDDITGLSPADLKQATSLLDSHNAVGLRIDGFPDHSVVCHAYRQAGGTQRSFIGGGALAVETTRSQAFFPEIYNDDWLFMLDPKGWLQPVAEVGQVWQDRYDPFRDPARARAEEFGDVIGEGAYWLLDQGRSVFDANERHWGMFLVRRRRFIKHVLALTEKRDLAADEKIHRVDALNGSLNRLADITPDLCASYLRAWAADRERWQHHLAGLPTGLARQQALRLLERASMPGLSWYIRDELDAGLVPVPPDSGLPCSPAGLERSA